MDIFTLTEDHIKLLRRMCVGWNGCETGAPEINPKRPYGNSDVVGDMAEILGTEGKICPHCEEFIEEQDHDAMLALHRQTEMALQIVLHTGSFVAGVYKRSNEYSMDWELMPETP